MAKPKKMPKTRKALSGTGKVLGGIIEVMAAASPRPSTPWTHKADPQQCTMHTHLADCEDRDCFWHRADKARWHAEHEGN